LLLALLAWGAVLLQLWLSLRLAHDKGASALQGLLSFLSYFTVLTNIFIALAATTGARRRIRDRPRGLYGIGIVGCATTSIAVVGMGYHLLLREVWDPQGLALVSDILLHYAVPVGAVMHWLAYPHFERLAWPAPQAWCAYPAAYFIYVLARGALVGNYPYHFIDVGLIGYGQASLNALGLLLVFIVVGLGVVAISRARHRRMWHG
jgi:hypothetical protein